jgi:hypothetical protein
MAACVSIHAPSFMESTPHREWPATRDLAQFRVSEGKFDAADSLLGDFAARHPKAPEALEATYWRALVRLDPSNPHASIPDAMSSLDLYLADPRSREHIREAAALRRVAVQLDAMSKVVASAAAVSKDPNTLAVARTTPDLRVDVNKSTLDSAAAADEIKRLKDELAKATAELERIRKRLAQPPPRL